MTAPTPSAEPPRLGTSAWSVRRVVRSGVLRIAVSAPLAFVVARVVLHEITLSEFGVWATLSSLLAIAALAEAGVTTEIQRRVADAWSRRDMDGVVLVVRQGLVLLVAAGAILIVVAVLLRSFIARFAFPGASAGSLHSAEGLVVAVVALVALTIITNGYFAVLEGVQRGDVRNAAAIVTAVVAAIATIVSVHITPSYWALFVGAAAGWLAGATVQTVALRRIVPAVRPALASISRADAWRYIALSTAVLVSSLANVIDHEWDKVVLAHYVSTGASAHYELGTTPVLYIRDAALVPLAVLLAGVAELRHANAEKMGRLTEAATVASMSVAALGTGVVVVFARPFFSLWLGAGHGRSAEAAQLLGIAMAIALLSAPWYFYAIGHEWHRFVAWSAGANLLVNLVASFALTMWIGFGGALVGSFMGSVAGTAVLYVQLVRRDRQPWLRRSVRPFVAPLAVAALAIVVHGPSYATTWSRLVLGCGAYLAAAVGIAAVTGGVPRWIMREIAHRPA